MELTYLLMLNAVPVLQEMGGKKFISVKGAYRVLRNIERINIELETFQKISMTIFDKYAEGEGEERKIPKDMIPEHTRDMDELVEEKANVDIIPLTLDMLDGVDISPSDLMAVSFMIAELQESKNEQQPKEEIPEP